MNIAIITFSDFNTNYGSILQALALKTYLMSEGHSVTFIRYREFHNSETRGLYNKVKSVLIKIYMYIYRKERAERQYNFRKFIDKHLSHTRLFTSEVDLEHNLQHFDAYICGSDQIWNLECLGGFREPYFLKFVPFNKIKIAYAPSMGDFYPDDETIKRIGEMLKDFTAISTRENKSSLLISQILNMNIPTVLDPTLLLNKEQWLQTVGELELPIKGEYAVCYFVRRTPYAECIIKYFQEKYSIPIYNVSDNHICIKGTRNDYITCSPDVFVNLVSKAKFCIGASFHLAAFSTIFDKHCYIIKTKHNESRISELYTSVNRLGHMITGDMNQFPSIEGSIDYTLYNNLVNKSKSFLRHSLSKSLNNV